MTKAQERARDEAREHLRGILKPGMTVYTLLEHVSRSGMYRAIRAYVIEDNEPRWISPRWIASATGLRYDEKREAVGLGGCGTDMGFELVYSLSYALWPDGFGCVGEHCPSNAHSNGDRDHTPHGHRGPRYDAEACAKGDTSSLEHWHPEAGYALRQRWL